MMPTTPSANFVVGQAGLALAAPDTLLDTMLRLGSHYEVRQFGVELSVGKMVISLHHLPIVAVFVTDQDEHFLVAFAPLIGACNHLPLDGLHDDRTFRSVAGRRLPSNPARRAIGRKGRWRKKYKGHIYYFSGGRGKTDRGAYDAALLAWEKKRLSLDAAAPKPPPGGL